MARAAIRRRLNRPLLWRAGRLIDSREETATARTLVLSVDEWPGHLPGQHVDIRLTAEDGYTTQRSYSIAAVSDGDVLELTVQLLPDGEVSPFLVRDYAIGDRIELRGPVGGWFVWDPTDPQPVLLIAGGSGIVPLMAMLRTRRAVGSRARFRLIYSTRSPDAVLYRAELMAAENEQIDILYTRSVPFGHPRPPGRLTQGDLERPGEPRPRVYVCGPTGFVEAAADHLLRQGYDAQEIRTERFGRSGD